MPYLKVAIQAHSDFNEILIAELNELGYDSFEERGGDDDFIYLADG